MDTENTTVRLSKETKDMVDALRESIQYYGKNRAIQAIRGKIKKACAFIYEGNLSNDAVIKAALHIMAHIFNDDGMLRIPVSNAEDGELLNANSRGMQ